MEHAEKQNIETVIIDENHPALLWGSDMYGEFAEMPCDLIAGNEVLVFDVPCPLYVTGIISGPHSVSSRSDLIAKSIRIGGPLYSMGDVCATEGDIRAENIHACDISAKKDILAVNEIVAEHNIESEQGKIVSAKSGIRAGGNITAKKSISVATRVFAGMDGTRGSDDCDNLVRCQHMARGELGYGILLLTPNK